MRRLKKVNLHPRAALPPTGVLAPWWMLALAGPPLSLLAAYGYYRGVEVPIRDLRRRTRRPTPIAGASLAA